MAANRLLVRLLGSSGTASTDIWIKSLPGTPRDTTTMFQPPVTAILNQDGNDPANGTEGAIPWGFYMNLDRNYTSIYIYNTKSYSVANGDDFYMSFNVIYEVE